MAENPQLELAYSFVNDTHSNVYLTGKAGTGKTTFLHRVRAEVPKRSAVVAPTGVAAINAKGVTIHSFFQLPFGLHIPGKGRDELHKSRFTKKRIRLIQSLELLIIDEISMVRADMLDAIDVVLRRFRDGDRPFGGLQLLMIGDLHQLPPVVTAEEQGLLHAHYDTPYFFGSHALQRSEAVRIELKHIYRQKSADFIELLNRVRAGRMDEDVRQKLNSRYMPDFQPPEEAGYITLTAHNKTAQGINSQKLKALPGDARQFHAKVEGNFPAHAYPTEEKLELKKNAQVIFVKNDPTGQQRFYNGKIGRVMKLRDEKVLVKCPDDEEAIEVGPAEWENRKFELNETSKKIEESITGKFKQFPLKLAWAMTIHKSQGLTFERVVIDAADAFAHGQVYVALSRCRSFEGIVLRSRIEPKSVRTDEVVQRYTERIRENEPDQADLKQHQHRYQCRLLEDLFTFGELKGLLATLLKLLQKHRTAITGDAQKQVRSIQDQVQRELVQVGESFLKQLQQAFEADTPPAENKWLQERLKKAGTYFREKTRPQLEALQALEILSDNKEVQKTITAKKTELEKELYRSLAAFKACEDGFDSRALVRARTDAEIEFKKQEPTKKESGGKKHSAPEAVDHPELFRTLVEWRKEKASEADLPAHRIVPMKAIVDIAQIVPTQMKSLKKASGIGKAKSEQFGDELLEMVRRYSQARELHKTDRLELAKGN